MLFSKGKPFDHRDRLRQQYTTRGGGIPSHHQGVVPLGDTSLGQVMSGGAEDLAASKRRPRGVVLQPSEEKDLRRVFETLAGCAKKDAKKRSKAAKLKKIEELNAKMDDQDDESNDESESDEDIGCQIDELHEEVDALEQELKQMDDEPKKKITAHDLDHAFRTLGLPKTKKYLEVE